MLSVLQVVRPATGGMRRHVATLCLGLPDRGVRCAVAAPLPVLDAPDDDTETHAAPIAAAFRPLRDLRAVAAVCRAASGRDLLHAHGLRGAWIASWASRRTRLPLVVTVHNMPGAAGTARRRLAGVALARARTVVAVSEAVADALRRGLARADVVQVVPNGVALPASVDQASARELLGIEPDAVVVLAAGRLAPEKGFDLLVAAAPEVVRRCPRVRILIAGDGSERAPLQRYAGEHGLTDHVRFVGQRPNMSAWYAAADVVAVPSRSEGQSLVAIEALAHARPVVASRVGGLPEVVRHGVTGLLVMPERPHELAEAIVALLQDDGARRSMGEAGRGDVAARFAVDRMLDSVAAIYRRAV